MKRSIYFFGLILLFAVVRSSKCDDSDTKTPSTTDKSSLNTEPPDFYSRPGNNETVYNSTKAKSTVSTFTKGSTISTKRTASTSAGLATVTSGTDISSSVGNELDGTLVYMENSKREEDRQVSVIMLEESIQNIASELRNRVRRDDEDEERSESSNTNESSQDNASEPDRDSNTDDSSRGNDSESSEEETDDSSSKNCDENGSSQVEPEETGSMDVVDREERSAKHSRESIENSEDRETLPPYWYRGPSFEERYWSSHEMESRRRFIKIPIFPGK